MTDDKRSARRLRSKPQFVNEPRQLHHAYQLFVRSVELVQAPGS